MRMDEPDAIIAIDDDDPLSLLDLLTHGGTSLAPTNAASERPSDYLDKLVTLPLDDLLREPTLVSDEGATVESDLTQLCFKEYSTFVSVHKASSAIGTAFDDFSSSLAGLVDALPALETGCQSFAADIQVTQKARARATIVLEYRDKLQDVLEIPHLMETCVRNGYYQEAMELAAHAKRTSHQMMGFPIIQDVAREVETVLQLMVTQLLALLREPVKLPALVKAVGYLRRLGGIDEKELGAIFLMSRLHNFRNQLVQIERDRAEPVRYLRRYIDLFREHVYDIISQYMSTFQDPQYLASFASHCIADLIGLVEAYIPRIASDSASMSSILVQLGYCAMSFGRVGLDFSALIAQPFATGVISSFTQICDTNTTALVTTLRESAKNATSPIDTLTSADHMAALRSNTTSPPSHQAWTEKHLPPPEISHYPLLAIYSNASVAALNGLRLLAPLELYADLIRILSEHLFEATSSILEYVDQAVNLPELNGMSHSPSAPRHSRTPSSPRAHLLRRNTETQLSPDIRAARRRDIRRLCVAFADVWVHLLCPFLLEALQEGIFVDLPKQLPTLNLTDKLRELQKWTETHGETDTVTASDTTAVNGDALGPESRQSVQSPVMQAHPEVEEMITDARNGHSMSPTIDALPHSTSSPPAEFQAENDLIASSTMSGLSTSPDPLTDLSDALLPDVEAAVLKAGASSNGQHAAAQTSQSNMPPDAPAIRPEGIADIVGEMSQQEAQSIIVPDTTQSLVSDEAETENLVNDGESGLMPSLMGVAGEESMNGEEEPNEADEQESENGQDDVAATSPANATDVAPASKPKKKKRRKKGLKQNS